MREMRPVLKSHNSKMSTKHTTAYRAAAMVSFDSHFTADLVRLLSALRAVTAQLSAILEQQTIEPEVWLSTSEAAQLARIGCTQSMRNWARSYALGIKVRDRWQIDRRLLEHFLRDRMESKQDARTARC